MKPPHVHGSGPNGQGLDFWEPGRLPSFSVPSTPLEPLQQPKPRIWINIVLFLATVLTTMIAGALQSLGTEALSSFRNLLQGLPFSVALLGILLAHELGHYFVSWHHRVPASLPYFIPVPTFIGTMGAIIRMRGVIRDRRILFDIGIAGPLAGMCLAIPATLIGLMHSEITAATGTGGGLELGDSLLFLALTKSIFGNIPDGQTVLLHPVAFAGWLGFFVTSLNLLPMGQLDGGHVLYGIFGPYHRLLARLTFLALIFWGVHGVFFHWKPVEWIWGMAFCWTGFRIAFGRPAGGFLRIFALFLLFMGIHENFVPSTLIWLFWAVLMTFLRLDHPPTRDVTFPLDWRRKVLGWMALFLFALTFTPRPFLQVLPG